MVSKFDPKAATDSPDEEPAAAPAAAEKRPASPYTKVVKDPSGQDLEVAWYPAPAGHATGAMTRNAIAAQEHSRDSKFEHKPMDAADPEVVAAARYVPMPNGGLMQLAENLYPGDVRDTEAMDRHVLDLFVLNRDIIRTDTDHTVGVMVRVPA